MNELTFGQELLKLSDSSLGFDHASLSDEIRAGQPERRGKRPELLGKRPAHKNLNVSEPAAHASSD